MYRSYFSRNFITILGNIFAQGMIYISLRKPITVADSKKRKADSTVVTTTVKVGTRTDHFLGYLPNIMEALDKKDLKEHYIVLDNAPIHKPANIRRYIEDRGYNCVYLPLYSSFWNHVEKFWSKVKFSVKGAFRNMK